MRELNGMPDQSLGNTFHMPPSYIHSNSYNGAISKEDENETSTMQSDSMINEFKNALRIISTDINASKQSHRNGDNGKIDELILYRLKIQSNNYLNNHQ